MARRDRRGDALRPVHFELHYTKWAEGSVLCVFGDTRVLCNVSVEDRVPPHVKEEGTGWITATYQLLPRSTHSRNEREARRGRQGGRTLEIQRLIGRALRGIVDRSKLGARTFTVDCDVLQADGGTRTASITGAWVALALACRRLRDEGKLKEDPLRDSIAAVSAGIVDGEVVLDLDYDEDHRADVDLNLVMTGRGGIVEIQGTSEGETPFDRDELERMLTVAQAGIAELLQAQKAVLEGTS